MDKIKYRCKSCGWTKELPAEWADVKPRFCPTPTCEMSVKKSRGRKSFRTEPDQLEMLIVQAEVPKARGPVQKEKSRKRK